MKNQFMFLVESFKCIFMSNKIFFYNVCVFLKKNIHLSLKQAGHFSRGKIHSTVSEFQYN